MLIDSPRAAFSLGLTRIESLCIDCRYRVINESLTAHGSVHVTVTGSKYLQLAVPFAVLIQGKSSGKTGNEVTLINIKIL